MATTRLTNVSAAFMYKEPKFGSESTTQTLMGEEVEILETSGEWVNVHQHDGYSGWISKYFLAEKPPGWDDHPRFSSKSLITWIYQSPDIAATTIRDMTLLSSLPILQHLDGWVQLLLPDGNQGWVLDDPRFQPKSADPEGLMETALRFMGIQYFWGGRSPKGFDCSGFVQSVFALNGFQLPRDAYMQAEIGKRVSDDLTQWKAGDLIFFSEKPQRVTHVALSLGEGDFIHASSYVRLNSMNPAHEDIYIGRYASIYTKTMRVL